MPLKYMGIKYPRCTEIIGECNAKPALVQWAANETVNHIKNTLLELENWMIDQGDILITHGPMPLLKSRANPLDVKTKYNRIPDSLVNTLNNQDYLNLHL